MSTDAELRAAIDALTKQVASLEASLAAPLEASHARWATQLRSRLTTLAASAAAPAAPLRGPPPVLCYCDRPAAQLDGRWVCAELVEGDFCILGREND